MKRNTDTLGSISKKKYPRTRQSRRFRVRKPHLMGRVQAGHFDRALLPNPLIFYKGEFPRLPIHGDWRTVVCPFHADHTPSLSVNVVTGGFCCHACEAKGGDVLDYQEQRYDQTFVEAAKALGAWRKS